MHPNLETRVGRRPDGHARRCGTRALAEDSVSRYSYGICRLYSYDTIYRLYSYDTIYRLYSYDIIYRLYSYERGGDNRAATT